jgi:hypothetical protein
MKGTLTKTEQGWRVQYSVINSIRSRPLHRDDISDILSNPDSKIENLVGKQVEFEIVTEWENGEVGVNGLNYAKLINNVPDVRKMVEHDYIEELAKGEIGWYDKHDDGQVKAFIAGYNKAKETLFTEEQVMEGMLQISEYYADNFGKDIDGHKKALEIIQSLKQSKQ